jgi:N6-L-threonylcarbamoyladenine synthase
LNDPAIMPSAAPPRLMLGIETSCDETAASVVAMDSAGRGEIRSNIVLSQIEEHAAFGGVVPEIAARAHVEALDGIVKAALSEAGVDLADIDGIAATAGPGLIGGLIVGLMTAKALAAVSDKPLHVINHLEGHALAPRLVADAPFPYLVLLVSGGHTQILLVRGVGNYERWATTIDDALGEAFDKTAKLLGLPYPGGPNVEKAAESGDENRFDFPRPLRGEKRPDLSFSGLKTAVRQAATSIAPLTEQDIADICASFQRAVTETLEERVGRSLDRFRAAYPDVKSPPLVVAGGVAANKAIRSMLEGLAARNGFVFVAPPMALCTDNAAMIAWAGLERLRADIGPPEAMTFAPRSRWPLDEDAAPLIGAGKRGAKA